VRDNCSYTYDSFTDDHDDDEPQIAASRTFADGQANFDTLMKNTLLVWDGMLAVAGVYPSPPGGATRTRRHL
jgi:hypothetical protein